MPRYLGKVFNFDLSPELLAAYVSFLSPVNAHLRDGVAPVLGWDPPVNPGGCPTTVRITFTCNNLLGALWLQFARSIEQDNRLQAGSDTGRRRRDKQQD
jgi:hypothetical protein